LHLSYLFVTSTFFFVLFNLVRYIKNEWFVVEKIAKEAPIPFQGLFTITSTPPKSKKKGCTAPLNLKGAYGKFVDAHCKPSEWMVQ